MDLLDSILNAMDAPPSASEQQKTLIKKQREMMERMQKRQKEELLRFRKYVDERMARFAKDDRVSIEFQPLDKVHRSVIHEIAENGGFIAMSFGQEDVDRHSVVYKKEHAPGEDEVTARRNGDGWNKEIAKEYAEQRKERLAQEQSDKKASTAAAAAEAGCSTDPDNTTGEVKPTTNYKAKYAHLIGESAGLQAAGKTETNQSYGFVPSKNKKDMRSIEQTLADIQAKKRLKLQQQQEQQQEQEQQQQQLEEEALEVSQSAAADPPGADHQ